MSSSSSVSSAPAQWLHATCDLIHNEREAEFCAKDGYTCVLCRSPDQQPPHLHPHWDHRLRFRSRPPSIRPAIGKTEQEVRDTTVLWSRARYNTPLWMLLTTQRFDHIFFENGDVFRVTNFFKMAGLATLRTLFTKSRAPTFDMTTTTPLATGHQCASSGRSGLLDKVSLLIASANICSTIDDDVSQARNMSTALAKVSWGSNNNFSHVLLSATPMTIWSRRMESRWASYSKVAIRDWSSNKKVSHDSPSRWWRVKNLYRSKVWLFLGWKNEHQT